MNIKDYLIAFGLAATGAAALLLVLWLMSLISWGVIYALLIGILIPIAYKAIDVWRKEDCLDLDDFCEAIFNSKKKESPNNSIIDDETYHGDWY